LLIIDVDDNSFHTNPEHLGRIINAIDAEIHGLFPIESPATNGQLKTAVKSNGKVIAPAKPAAKAPAKPAAKPAPKPALAKAKR